MPPLPVAAKRCTRLRGQDPHSPAATRMGAEQKKTSIHFRLCFTSRRRTDIATILYFSQRIFQSQRWVLYVIVLRFLPNHLPADDRLLASVVVDLGLFLWRL